MDMEQPKLAIRVAQAAEALEISRSKAYEMIARGELPAIRIGGSVRVPLAALREWVAQKSA